MIKLFGRRARLRAAIRANVPDAERQAQVTVYESPDPGLRSWMLDPRTWNILVADDDVSVITRVMRALGDDPRYVIHTSNDGRMAVECARQVRPDMVFVNPQMPTLDGARLYDSLRDALGARARIVLMSDGAREPSTDGQVRKGFRPEELLRVTRALLDGRVGAGVGV